MQVIALNKRRNIMDKSGFGSVYNNSYLNSNGVSLGVGSQTSQGGGTANVNFDNNSKFRGTDVSANRQFNNGSAAISAGFDSRGKFSGANIAGQHKGTSASAGLIHAGNLLAGKYQLSSEEWGHPPADHKGSVNQLGLSQSNRSTTVSTHVNVRGGKPIGGGISFTKRF